MRPLDQSVEPNSASEWDMTDKHRVLWLVPIKLLQEVAHASKKEQGKGNGKKVAIMAKAVTRWAWTMMPVQVTCGGPDSMQVTLLA